MKIKKNLCWLLVAAFVLLTGCSKQKEEQGYTVYYTNTAGTRLMEVNYNPSAQNFDEMMKELMGQLTSAPAGYSSALPADVKYNGYERGIDALRIDFSKEYYNLTNTEEVLLRAAVVKTVSQIPGVTKVMFTVDKEQLLDQDGEPASVMDANTFIDTKEGGINSYLYTTLKLYFANKSGDQITEELRDLHYSSNMVLERVVVEQILKGPETLGLRAVVSDTAKILNIYVQNGVCNINFDAEFNRATEDDVEPEAAIYAIVNSICSTCDNITGVQFQINGESDIMFRDKVDLNQVFAMNTKWVESDEMQTEASAINDSAKLTVAEEQETKTGETQTESHQMSEAASENESGAALSGGNSVVGVEPSLTEG